MKFRILLLLICIASIDGFSQSAWQKSYGTIYRDNARQMINLANGGYLLAGENYVESNDVYTTGYLVKTKANGDTIWTKRFFPSDSGLGIIIPTIYEINPNAYLVSKINALMILDSSGNIVWSKNNYNASLFSILDVKNVSTIIYSSGSKIGSIDTSGTNNWIINFPHNIARRIVIKSSNGTYCYLYKDSVNNVYFKEISWTGQIIRDTLLPFLPIHSVSGLLYQDKDGNFVSVNDELAINVIKFSYKLELLWKKSNNVVATHYSDVIIQTSDNYYVIVGKYLNDPAGDISFFKMDTSGNKIFFKSLARFGKQEEAVSALGDHDGGVVLFGRGEDGPIGNFDLILAKVNEDGTLSSPFLSYGKELYITLFPNPTQDYLHINSKENISGKINIYKLDGICVFEKEIGNEDSWNINVQELTTGIYIIRFSDVINGSFYCQKFIKK